MAESTLKSEEVIAVGSKFVIPRAEILTLSGEIISVNDPKTLSERLLDLYHNPRPDEIPQQKPFVRFGYRHLKFDFELENLEPFQLTFEQCIYKQWQSLGGPKIEDRPRYWMSEESLGCPELTMPMNTGEEIGEFFLKASIESSFMLVEYYSSSPGVHAYDDYIVLGLKPKEGAIAEGELWKLRSHNCGDTYSMLWEWEHKGQDDWF